MPDEDHEIQILIKYIIKECILYIIKPQKSAECKGKSRTGNGQDPDKGVTAQRRGP
jgi:hypothetical protein